MLLRPFLDLPRTVTEGACAAARLDTWQDPHNADEGFARVRARRAVADLQDLLGPGVDAALARSAELLRADADALEEMSEAAYIELGDPPWPVDRVAAHPMAVRTRLFRRMAQAATARTVAPSAVHLRAVDELITRWHGQGPIDLPGGVRIHRSEGSIWPQAQAPG